MRYRFLLLIFSFCLNERTLAQDRPNLPASFGEILKTKLKVFYSPSQGQIEDLLKGEVLSSGKVDSPTEKEQNMALFVSGIHPRNCTKAMRKLSLYERL